VQTPIRLEESGCPERHRCSACSQRRLAYLLLCYRQLAVCAYVVYRFVFFDTIVFGSICAYVLSPVIVIAPTISNAP